VGNVIVSVQGPQPEWLWRWRERSWPAAHTLAEEQSQSRQRANNRAEQLRREFPAGSAWVRRRSVTGPERVTIVGTDLGDVQYRSPRGVTTVSPRVFRAHFLREGQRQRLQSSRTPKPQRQYATRPRGARDGGSTGKILGHRAKVHAAATRTTAGGQSLSRAGTGAKSSVTLPPARGGRGHPAPANTRRSGGWPHRASAARASR
jgi:hypothetical protein